MSYSAAAGRYETMRYNRCGRSGLELPAISLGLWYNFGGVDPFANARAMARRAFDRGVTHFDLADNYGPPPGSAEETFGRILALDLAPHRDELVISTKAGWDMWPGPYGDHGSRKHLLAGLDQSLRRMGLEYVDVFYSHRPDPATPLEETMGALATAVRQGKALYAGISAYSPEQTRAAAHVLRSLGTPCLIHQPRYNLLDRDIEHGLLDVLAEEGIGCITFSPLAQGLLTDRYLLGIPEGARASKTERVWLTSADVAATRNRVRALHAIAERGSRSLAQLALAWVLRLPQVTSVLVGASSVAQLDANLDTLLLPPLSTGELDEIEAALKR
jgi:L-glyceraldehyde 3-phosphate reductase